MWRCLGHTYKCGGLRQSLSKSNRGRHRKLRLWHKAVRSRGRFGSQLFCYLTARFVQGVSIAGSAGRSAEDFMFQADWNNENMLWDGHTTLQASFERSYSYVPQTAMSIPERNTVCNDGDKEVSKSFVCCWQLFRDNSAAPLNKYCTCFIFCSCFVKELFS